MGIKSLGARGLWHRGQRDLSAATGLFLRTLYAYVFIKLPIKSPAVKNKNRKISSTPQLFIFK